MSVMNETRSAGTAGAEGQFEQYHGPSQTLLLPSIQASVSSDEPTLASEGEAPAEGDFESTSLSPNHIQGYQPPAGNLTENPGSSQDDVVDSAANLKGSSATSGSQWRPTYLRRRVLLSFSVIFLLVIALLEILNVLSARNGGIAAGRNKYHYLWTYGPTAFFTLIAALFNRVEHQAKLMAPWERLSRHPAPAQETLLLDYISPLQPVAIYKSLWNKDFAVAATTTISLIIKILIVLSSGLITLSRIAVHHAAIPMEIQNAFLDDESALRASTSIPYFVMQGLIAGSDYPPGIFNELAYQSFQNNLPSTAQYQVMVDGLATDLQCEVVNLEASTADVGYQGSYMRLNIVSPRCHAVTDLHGRSPPFEHSRDGQGLVHFWKLEPVQCNGTKDDTGRRVLVISGLQEWFVNQTIPADEVRSGDPCFLHGCSNNLQGRLLKSAQLLCDARYEIAKVNVVQNGTEVQSVTLAGEPRNRTLDHISPWHFMDSATSHFDYTLVYESDSNGWRETTIGQDRLQVDRFTYNALETQAPSVTGASMLYDPTFIQSIITRHYRQRGAIIASQLSMKSVSLNATGSATIFDDRLMARGWAVHWMAGLISSCLFLLLLTALIIPKHGILPQSPSTLPGIAALVKHSPDLLERLRYSGDANANTLRLQLNGSTFRSKTIHEQSQCIEPNDSKRRIIIRESILESSGNLPWSFHQSESAHSHPWVLHPVSRLGLGLILMASIITLEIMLNQSRSQEGLGSAGDNPYIHYTWTSLPALAFGCLAMMLSSMDFSMRSLAPYTILSRVVSGNMFMKLDFLDMSVPSAILRQAKLRNIGALATTSQLLVASFFTVFSASLFQGVYLPTTTTALLRANNSFGYPSGAFDATPALILLSNRSYPSFTYEDLAFPQFLPDGAFTPSEVSNKSLLSINAVLPAFRSRLECRMYNASHIHAQIENSSYNDEQQFFFEFDIDDQGDMLYTNGTGRVKLPSSTSYVGQNIFNGSSEHAQGAFLWGKVANSKVVHTAAMSCNHSVEVVDVETVFIGTDLAIDAKNPPRAVPNSERAVNDLFNSTDFFASYLRGAIPITSEDDDGLSEFFKLLTNSRWAIPLSKFEGGSDADIAAAIKFQIGIFFAQALNKGRIPATETNFTLTHEQVLEGENDASRTYEATVVDKTGRQRVVQDAVSTRVLEALLLATLILLGVGWVWMPKTNVLPKRSPTTIASAVALLAGGNLTEWLHDEDSDTMGALGERVNTTKFWMGWGNVPDEEGILMGNENENGISRFGIFAVKADPDDDEQARSLHRTTTGG